MKHLKIALVLLGTLLLLFSCTSILTENNQPGNTPTDFYVKHDCWESPFSPHEILDSWPIIKTKMANDYMALVMVGNPKIDWEQKRELEMDIPEGELTLAVIFVFVELSTGKIELFSFGYVNKDSTFYIYAWNIHQNCYTLYKTGVEKGGGTSI